MCQGFISISVVTLWKSKGKLFIAVSLKQKQTASALEGLSAAGEKRGKDKAKARLVHFNHSNQNHGSARHSRQKVLHASVTWCHLVDTGWKPTASSTQRLPSSTFSLIEVVTEGDPHGFRFSCTPQGLKHH